MSVVENIQKITLVYENEEEREKLIQEILKMGTIISEFVCTNGSIILIDRFDKTVELEENHCCSPLLPKYVPVIDGNECCSPH